MLINDMIKKHFTLALLVCLLLSTSYMDAQNKGRVKMKTKPKTEVKNVKTENPIFKSMLESTAKIMVIDSAVVDKDDFLSSIPFNKELGTITYGKGVSSYSNGYGDRRIYASGDSVSGRYLYITDKIGGKWNTAKKIDYFDSSLHSYEYPFLMSDGITLYFSAKGSKSMGGYDIFTTNYDSDKGQFFDPVNYGLPYNSTANDYLLAIDDMDSLGWLVSDRFQPEGKVCIYTFVPTTTRKSFENDDIDDAELTGYAKLQKISDTWQFGNRREALDRLNKLKELNLSKNNSKDKILFVVNDDIIYTKLSDFKTETSRKQFAELISLKEKVKTEEADISDMYDDYHAAAKNRKRSMTAKIKDAETSLDNLRNEINSLEKKIRKEEIE